MSSEKDPAKANPSEPQFQQTVLKDVTARDIQVGQIVQKIVNLGLPFNSQHLRFVQFLANTMYASLLLGGFWRLWQHGADEKTLLLLILGSGLLFLTGVYYTWFWKPKEDKQTQRLRRLAIVACIAIPLLTWGSFFVWSALPPPQVLVLVANFANSQNADYRDNWRVTESILKNLQNAAKPYADVKVQTLDQTITAQDGSEDARAVGEQKKAAIVIWGDYAVTDTHVQISVHFELLKPPIGFPKLEPTASGQAQTLAIDELNSFKLQTRLSNEMTYLTLFTLGVTRYTAEDWNGAIDRFSDALDQVDTTASVLNQSHVFSYRGISYLSKGDHPRAIADFTQAINLQPGDAETYNGRGVVYTLQGNYAQAIADFNQALKLEPDFAGAYSNRGTVYNEQGNYIQAIADFNQVVELKPNAADSYYNRGVVYTRQNDHIKAIADYDQALKLKSDYTEAYVNRGIAYGSQGNYTQAIADFNQALKLNPNDALAYYNRGLTYDKQGNYPQAITDYTQAIKLKPDYATAYNERGIAYKNQGNYSQSIADFTQAIKLQPDLAETYNNRGNAYRYQRNYAKAISDYTQAIRLQPNLVGAYHNRAGAYSLQRDVKAALEDLQRAIDLDGSFRGLAKIDASFDNIRQDRQFQALVGQ